jgi:ABC-type Fe3+ transport system permease subunit
VLAVVTLVVLLPVFALAREAVAVDDALTLAPFTEVGSTDVAGRGGASLLRWSATYALVSAAAATFLAWLSGPLVAAAMASRRSRWVRVGAVLAMLPVVLSPLVLAVGVREVAGEVGVDLQSTWAIMAAVHALLVYPLAVRLVAVPRRSDDVRLREAALLLGQEPGRARWRWERSRTARALVAAFLVCAALSLGEAGASTLLAPSSATPSAPAILEAARASAAAGGVGVGGYALATVLTAVSVIAFVAGERLRPPRAVQGAGRRVEGR